MFENLLAQEEVKAILVRDLRCDQVPPVFLFAGPPASGKMTAALETARVLSCRHSGDWNCDCPDCGNHRSLLHPDLMILGKRGCPEEIIVAKELLLRSPGTSSTFFFIRAVRKLLARFNPVLWEGEEAKLSKAAALLQSVEEELGLLDVSAPQTGEGTNAAAVKTVEALCDDCASLEAFVPEFPSVSMIRNMETWAQLAPLGKRKTVVIENADRMQDSARNAMLKILEEPPASVRFILLTSRRASMMSTILSRSRVINFQPRNADATKLIIRRVFKSETEAPRLQDYFDAKKPYPSAKAHLHAQLMTGMLLKSGGAETRLHGAGALDMVREAEASGMTIQELIDQMASETGNFGSKDKSYAGSLIQFLRTLQGSFSALLADSGQDPWLLPLVERWSRLVRDTAIQSMTYNRNPELLLKVFADSCGECI